MTHMLNRRHLLAGAGAAAGLSSLAACGPKPAASDSELRISWWGGSSNHRATLEALRLFEEANPGIRVKGEYTGFSGHLERLTTQLAGDTAPDVMQINWYWQTLFSRDGKGFFDLNGLKDIIDLSQFDERTLQMGTTYGHLNALAVTNAARLFYFNATTFDKAGVKLPTTWDELKATGPQMHKALGNAYYPIDGTFQDFAAMARSYVVQKTGKPLVDTASKSLNCTPEDMREVAQLYADLTQSHTWPAAKVRASYGNVPQQEMRPWINGEYAGTYQWNSAIDKYTDTLTPGQTVKLAPYPMRDGATDAGLLYRPAMLFVINRNCKQPEAAAKLINFLLNDPAGVRAMGLMRGVPVSAIAQKTLKDDGLLDGLKLESEAQIEALPKTVLESPYFEHPRVRDGFQDILEGLGYGRLSQKEAGERLYTDINAILHRVVR
ncbi:MAG: ABC transporter substrate-binding protein [Asticcacaulis sp.]